VGAEQKYMKYNHFNEEISGDVGQPSLGVFIFEMVIVATIILLGIYFLK